MSKENNNLQRLDNSNQYHTGMYLDTTQVSTFPRTAHGTYMYLYMCVFYHTLTYRNYMFNLHSSRRLSYRRLSMWTAMSWLSLTTCSYTTIPSMGEGLADSTLQKVRLLIWRMVGTFLHLIICYAPFSPSLQITHLL